MQKIKRPLSIILTILMLVTMIPFSSLTASAGYVQYVGGFAVIHATEGADYTYSDGVLTIISDHQIAIHNRDRSAPTTDRIFVKKDVSANIELMGVNIDTSNKGVPAFEIAEGSTGNVTITLGLDVGIGSVGSGAEVVERSKNYLKSGFKCAGLQKNGGETYKGLFDQEATKTGKLTIKGDGWLYATGGNGAAGIGGAYGKNTCNIEIQGGSVDAIATSEDFVVDGVCMGGAGIGGGSSNAGISYGDFGGIGTNITISGGIVNAKGAESANAIGEGYMHRGDIGNCSNIVISGGYVTLTSGILAFCVGGNSNSNNKVTGGVVWFVPNGIFGVSTQSMSYSNCIIYDNKAGKVYGNYTLPWNHAVLAEHTLTIPKGSTLTVPAGVTLTNKGTITKEGNLVVNGSIVCDGHSFVNGVCTRCFNPCTHTKYSNGFCTGCGKVTNEITLNSNGYYEISNAGELYCFAEKSQSDKTINAILTADIAVNEGTITAESTGVRSWTPIAYNYAGTFDGNGHSVSGLYLKSSESDQGFVRRLSDKGTVKNLTIKNSYISGGQYTGGITGDNSGTIDNCHISATVNGTKYVGGIVGDNGGIVTNCSSAGVVTGSEAYTGGIAGCHDDTVLTNCHNSATVSGDNTVGGVVGWCASTITKCSNSGKISATNSTVGGITGLAIIYDGAAVSYCSNTGDVTGSDFVGGIVGSGHDTPITNCYSTGKATFNENGPGQFTALGIIVGHNNSYNAAVNCYYLDTAITTGGIFNIDYKGHTESATLEQFKSGEIAYRLNGTGEKVWCQKIGTEELPQLKGSKVYYGYTSCSATAEKKYTNTSTATATKPSHEAKTVANCTDLAVCKNCGETYGSKNPNNHKSTEIRSEYVDDTYHKDYHVCCDALIGSCTHSRSTAANCISKAYCNECKSYYGSINASNHASEFTWVDNGYGTHSKKWNCCNLLENETKPHSFTITADDEKNVITARCNDCGYEDSLTLVVPEGELVYDGTSEYVYAKGYIHGIDSKREIYANGELYNGTWSDAGKYKQVLTVGGKSVSVEYEIKKKELTVRELWVAGKDFDGTRKMKVYDVYFEGLMPADDVEANCDNAYTYAPSSRAGDYTTVSGLTGVTVEGRDMKNYIIPEISEDIEYSADYSIYPYEVRIVPEHQYITDASKLDTTKFTIDTEIPEGYTIEGMAVALDGTEIIVVDDSNAKVMYGDEDFTDCFYFNTYATAAVVICCEGHKSDENGFCSTGTCSAFEAAKLSNNGTPDYDGDDCYEVSNAGQLFWFAKQVNGYGNQYANVKLTADIDLNPGYTFNSDGTYTGGNTPREWTPIGYADGYSPYTGVFDGNGHTISGMYVNTPDESFVGMFGGCDYGNTIKNLKLTNSYFSGRSYVGSLIGYAGTTVSGCYIDNTVTVKGNGYSVGGIVGELAYNAVKNCISFANVIDEDSELFVGKNYGEVINCYYSSNSTGTTRTDAEAKTEEEFASGEVVYLLQSGVEEEYIYDAEADDYIPVIPHIWGQKLGTDKYPVICGEKVYYGYKDCNATEKTYCNNNAYDEIPTHSFENGKCTICDDKAPDAKLVSIFGDINLALEETEANIFTGITELPAGTYKFNVDDNGTIRGMNFTYTDTATIDYSAGYKAPSTFNATGGRYTFTYNATAKKLTIKFKSFEDIVELTGDINAELVRPDKNTTVFTGTIRLDAGSYKFNVNENGVIFGMNFAFDDTIYNKEFIYKAPATFNATGGIYSVRYDTANNQLKILKAPEGLGDVSIFGDISLPLATQGNGVYSAQTILDKGSYDIRVDAFGTLYGNGTKFTNTINTAFNTEWKAAATLNVTEKQKFTFFFDTNTNKVKVFNAPIDTTKVKVAFDDIDALVLTSADGVTFKGTVALEAGTYTFRMDEFGTPMGGKYSFTDNSNSMTYNATYASATTMTATGGEYTFTYNANTNALKVSKV